MIFNTNSFERKILFVVIALFTVSCAFYIFFNTGSKTIFIFESMDSESLYCETRYVPRDNIQGDLHFFVDELLLGPISNRYRPLFANDTKVLSCFLSEEGTLYINLNENALFAGNESSKTTLAVDLLKKNVLKNYKYVDNIDVFIMGNLVAQK